MSRLTLFLLALIALPLACIAFVRSGRRPGAAESRAASAPAAAATAPAGQAGDAAAPAPEPEAAPGIWARLNELAFGVPARPPADQPLHREVAAAVDALLTGPVLKPEYAPRRPLLLPKLVQAVNDENVSRREQATLIAQDPALAGNLLRLANSAFYRVNAEPVESIDRAVALLGTSGIRSLMAAALLQPVFRTAAGEFKPFPEIIWEHTQYAATAAEAYAAIIADEDPFAGQLLALLHGLGTILVFRAALDEYARNGVSADAATVAALIDRHAAAVARRIAQEWELSSRVLTALEEQSPERQLGTLTGLGRSLRFGRYCGAVAVLRRAGCLDDEASKAGVVAGGFAGPDCERIWARLARQVASSGPPVDT
ncbi:MAG TPA: HDOD domain-containing protein [Steroidobacteraceae bacterium]|nr:HDOD domain-containing protein [Steroidobacteraceae bacterium]